MIKFLRKARLLRLPLHERYLACWGVLSSSIIIDKGWLYAPRVDLVNAVGSYPRFDNKPRAKLMIARLCQLMVQ